MGEVPGLTGLPECHRQQGRRLPRGARADGYGTKTSTRLADGRELIYFDERPGRDRSRPDTRDLDPILTASQIRYDPLVDQWVVIAGHRQARTHLPSLADCPLCPSSAGHPTEIPHDDYDVVVFENRFPSLANSRADPLAAPHPNG